MNLYSFLGEQLKRVNDWLSFAEAKNAGLLAINVALLTIMASLKYDYSDSNLFYVTVVSKIIGYIAAVISTGIALFSIFPRESPSPKKNDTNRELNLIYFGDIACVADKRAYLALIKERYFSGNSESEASEAEELLLDLAHEIIINSRIAELKCGLFKAAIIFAAISFACFICFAICCSIMV